MRWRWLVVVVSMATVAEGQEVADAGDAAVPSGGVALARAVADRFVECAAAEGEPLAEADRRLVGSRVASGSHRAPPMS